LYLILASMSQKHRDSLRRTDLYFKVQVEHDEHEPIEQLVQDIPRQIQKVYGVKAVELSYVVSE